MGYNKNISNYYKKQEAAKKAEQAKKRNALTIKVICLILAIAAVIGIVIAIVSALHQPEVVTVALVVKDYGTITLELYPEIAPITVDHVVAYIEDGFYDGLIFHRVIEDFMIQGGDPTGTGYGDSSLPTIKGEFSSNGVKNDLSFKRGVIGMARNGFSNNSASTQFFICHKDSEHLDGSYAAFGKVIDGMNVVDAIATCEKTDDIDSSGTHSVPKEKIVIEKMYVIKDGE